MGDEEGGVDKEEQREEYTERMVEGDKLELSYEKVKKEG